MRIRRITIEGFGPFKDAQVVDLAAFADDGLFLIGGETGAGKSTILDAIVYALYGDAPRWDDVNATPRFRSDYCGPGDATLAVLEFETNGAEYRITRSPEYERPKARGEGTTTQKATALLQRREDADWVGLADKPRDVAGCVTDLVHLTQDEFLQVILLAQGRFQRFLLAPSDERLSLLSKLFGARRFKDYQDRIAERRRTLRAETEQNRSAVAMLVGTIPAPPALGSPEPGRELEWADAIAEAAAQELRVRDAAFEIATADEAAATARRDVAERQHRRELAAAALADLEDRRPAIERERALVVAAERAERVRPLIDAAAIAASALEQVQAAVEVARRGYLGAAADEHLAAEVTRLEQELGALAGALADEQRAEQLDTDLERAAADVARLAEQLDRTTATIARLAAERESLVATAAQVEPRRDRCEAVQRRVESASEAQAIASELREAEEDLLSADRAYETALHRANVLMDQHLHGQAAILAADLLPGVPCAVCGSPDHPAPAVPEGDAVDRAAVDTARAAADLLDPVRTAARTRADELRTKDAALRALVGETDLATLVTELDHAQADLDAGLAAAIRLAEIDEALTADGGLNTVRSKTEHDLAACRTRETELTATRTELRARADLLRGDYDTVAARNAALAAERDAASALADAIAQRDARAAQLAAALAHQDEKAQSEGFASAAEATAALLDERTLSARTKEVEQYDAAITGLRAQLAAPDLQGMAEEVIDLAGAIAQVHATKERRDAAAAARTTASNAVDALAVQREHLRQLLAAASEAAAAYAVLERLADTVVGKAPNSTGMSLESYYVAAELEAVLAAANSRLRVMTGGRYQLLHTERGILHANARAGLELEVMDENTGRARDPHTLSGGEQFLTSLALALGLAEVVTARAGGVELDTLFVDEGFGSLSPDFLEVAMTTLDSLKAGGRTVGVISHVDAMKESIGAQLQVVREPGGWSTILQPT